MNDLPELTTTTFIGIMTAITGNILISLALNLQKLAHKRMKFRRTQNADYQNSKNVNSNNTSGEPENRPLSNSRVNGDGADYLQPTTNGSTESNINTPVETRPMIPFPNSPTPRDYGTIISESARPRVHSHPISKKKRTLTSFIPFLFPAKKVKNTSQDALSLPVDVMSEEAALSNRSAGQKSTSREADALEEGNETDYLRSKLWWFGFLLMNIGEIGNFISYAWAPASVVAPLGTFALMANCVFAPLMLKERFRKRDLLGILIAIIGAVTVVLASNSSDIRLDPDALVNAICQPAFIIYSCIYVGGAIVLATLSEGNIGQQWVFVDVGLCALFGGFTVLSTKAISTLITMEWIEVFTKWITYPVLVVLAFTGVGQIRYLNRALMRFDSKAVIPVQFVLFTLSAIIGSAILYGDFRTAKFHQIVTFLYGCAATFLGVFIIAWAPAISTPGENDNTNEGDEGTALSPVSEEVRLGLGTPGRRRRATLILPSGVRDTPVLRSPHSAVSLIGLSPAQHLLLVHTPPRDVPIASRIREDVERGTWTPNSSERRRTMSWFGDDARGSPAGTRNNSIGRLRNGAGIRVGSLEQSSVHR